MNPIDEIKKSFINKKILDAKTVRDFVVFLLDENNLSMYCKDVYTNKRKEKYSCFNYNNSYINIEVNFIFNTLRKYSDVNMINFEILMDVFHEINHVVQYKDYLNKDQFFSNIKSQMINDDITAILYDFNTYKKYNNHLMMEHDSYVKQCEGTIEFIKLIFPNIDTYNLYTFNYQIAHYLTLTYKNIYKFGYLLDEDISSPYGKHLIIYNDKLLKKIYKEKPYTLVKDCPMIQPFNELESLTYGLPLQKDVKLYLENLRKEKIFTSNVFENLKRIKR